MYFEFKLLDGLSRLEMPGEVKVADGKWHNITVTRLGNVAILQVDYTGRVSRNTGEKCLRSSVYTRRAFWLQSFAARSTRLIGAAKIGTHSICAQPLFWYKVENRMIVNCQI